MTKLFACIAIAAISYCNPTLAQWKKVTSPAPNASVICLKSLGGSIFAGLSNFQGIAASTDDGATWMAVNKGLSNNPSVFSMAIIEQAIFAVVGTGSNAYGSIFMSANYGSSWTKIPVTNTVLDSCIEIIASGSDVYVALKNGLGIYKSRDNGSTWFQVGKGTAKGGPLLVNGSSIYAGFSFSNDDGATWNAMPSPSATMAASAKIGSVFFFGDNSGKGVFHTPDNGSNWYRDSVGLKNLPVSNMLNIGPNLYIGTNGGGVYKLINQGASWVADNKGISQPTAGSMCFGTSATDIYWASADNSLYKKSLLTKVDEFDLSDKLSIFPNPSTGVFQIIMESGKQINTVAVFNLFGERISTQNNLNELDLSDAPKGIYIAKITVGMQFSISKLILQ